MPRFNLTRLAFAGHLVALHLAFSIPATAKDYGWFLPSGTAGAFASAASWKDLTPGVDPPNPAGPPGAADNADISSGAIVNASGGSVNKLTFGSSATFNLSGGFSVTSLEALFTLSGSGQMSATTVSGRPLVAGGHLTADNWTARSASASASGAVVIKSGVAGDTANGNTFNLNLRTSATIEVQGAASDVSGVVESGAKATLASLRNLNTSAPTLEVSGANSTLSISGVCRIRDGSLDVFDGATVTVGGDLSFEGAVSGGQPLSASSRWQGAGTQVTASSVLNLGGNAGVYDLELRSGAFLSSGSSTFIGSAVGAEGHLTLDGAGTRWESGGLGASVGDLGKGSLTITRGAKANFATGSVLAIGFDAQGTVVVDGPDSLFGAQSSDELTLGLNAGSNGQATISNGGRMLAGKHLMIGNSGTGRLTVNSGSVVQTAGPTVFTEVGIGAGGAGFVTISGVGTIAEFGKFVAGGGGSAECNVTNGAVVTTRGVLIAAATGSTGRIALDGGATWTCETFTAVGSDDEVAGSGTGRLSVAGTATFRTKTGLGISPKNVVAVTAGGRIAVGTGAFGPAGTVRISEGGALSGGGKVQGQVVIGSGGILIPGESPGTLTVDGGFEQEAGGELELELGGAAIGTATDLLKITGAAKLGGRLRVKLVNGFNPTATQSFKLLTAASVTGTFAEVIGADVTYSATGFSVKPKAEPSTLTVSVSPSAGGKVSAGFLGETTRKVGFSYAVTATPAPGLVFAGWTGSLTSTNPKLSFVMVPNMTLQANFVANPFVPSFLGAYAGLVENADAAGSANGLLRLKLTKTGSFSATFLLGGKTYRFSGLFTGLGRFARQVKTGGKTLDVTLDLDLAGADRATGSIVLDAQTYAVATDHATFTATAPTDRAGAYTLLLPPNADNSDPLAPRPQGHGWATIAVALAGNVKVAGKLGDGVTFSAGGMLAKDGRFGLFASLYKGLGRLGGTLDFAALPRNASPAVSDLTGTLTWTKPAEPRNKIFPKPFATTLAALGSFYAPPLPGERTFPGLPSSGAATLQFLGGNLPASATKAIVISPTNVVSYPAPASAADKLKLTFKAKTGAFGGSFLHAGTGQAAAFTGVVLQKQTRGAGLFLGTSDSGKVELTP